MKRNFMQAATRGIALQPVGPEILRTLGPEGAEALTAKTMRCFTTLSRRFASSHAQLFDKTRAPLNAQHAVFALPQRPMPRQTPLLESASLGWNERLAVLRNTNNIVALRALKDEELSVRIDGKTSSATLLDMVILAVHNPGTPMLARVATLHEARFINDALLHLEDDLGYGRGHLRLVLEVTTLQDASITATLEVLPGFIHETRDHICALQLAGLPAALQNVVADKAARQGVGGICLMPQEPTLLTA